ncbi:MAG TPA: 16S rRNA (cytosine(967)-C(5))-methyltransferase RsmB [Blastocatellia bacterium]|nr:16S rRNA (cytosine(967)-C(5))-methyltransferase RsmB [Blastocatellia bacterium]
MTSQVKVTTVRRAAYEALRRVEEDQAYATNLLLSPRFQTLSREDQALLRELTLGVLRWQGRLDFLIEHYSRRKIARLDSEVVIALRLGLYQLKFLSRIPSHAAVNESVNLVRELKKQSAAPFCNAVLRAAQRDESLDLDRLIEDPLERLSVETSHPAWLLRRWTERFGAEASALAMANNRAPRTAFRFLSGRSSESETRAWFAAHGIETRRSELAPQAEILENGNLSGSSEPVNEGWIYLQDEASQLVGHLAGGSAAAGQRALDLCAAPGGKTSLLASLLPQPSLIVASDRHLHRLQTMKELSARQGIEGIRLVQLDAAAELPFAEPGGFDRVLLDAPCSGLGTLQRHPEIKWRIDPGKLRELAELQRRLIVNASRQVAPGGLLIYSVCSTEPEEGEEAIAWFRRDRPEYRDLTRERLTELGLDPSSMLTESFGARTFPHRQGTEGFFVCVLWRRK